jgi:tetratricopeptide (TPR) repeat protein
MKKIIYSLFVLLTMTTVGCDNYIDITPKGAVTVDSAQQYYELIATPMRAYYPSSFILLSDDQWVKESEILGFESISADGINFTFNEKADRTILSDNNLYENIYSFILRSNLVIDNVDKGQGSQELKTLAKAEARTFRAFDHFLAVNTFAKAYNPETAASDGGVCIMDRYDLEATPVKSTVAEVYNFIINELEQAVPLLEEKPVNIYHPNRAFGYALLAKVYLFHRDWAKAQEAAEQSLKLNSQLADYNLINDAGGTARYKNFAKDGNPEVLSYHWMAGWGSGEQVCLYHYGMISPELKSLFESNDLRYSLFLRDTGTSITSWFDSGSGAAIWTPAITNLDRFTYMSVGLRTAEVYLIMAEALARQNNLTEAANYVSQLRDKRIKGGNGHVDAPATQVEMVKMIIDERRKELLFGFNRFFDLKRLNIEPAYQKTITRVFPVLNISEAHPQQTYTLKPDSRLYVIPFPHSARDKNPNLTLNTDE